MTLKCIFLGFFSQTWTAFIVNYTFQTVTITIDALLCGVFDILQAVLLLQCTYLIDYLVLLLEPSNAIRDESSSTKSLLKEICETHSKLQSFVNNLCETFAVINFFQLVQSASFICISLYGLTTSTDFTENNIRIVLIIIVLNQIALYCFVGQHLTNKFEELYYKMVQINWYEFTREEKKAYLIMLHNIQQPVVVRTYCNELSLEVFGAVSLTMKNI